MNCLPCCFARGGADCRLSMWSRCLGSELNSAAADIAYHLHLTPEGSVVHCQRRSVARQPPALRRLNDVSGAIFRPDELRNGAFSGSI